MRKLVVSAIIAIGNILLGPAWAADAPANYWKLTFSDDFKGQRAGESSTCYTMAPQCAAEYQSGPFTCPSTPAVLQHLDKCKWTVMHQNNWMSPNVNAFTSDQVTVDPSLDDGVLILSAHSNVKSAYDCKWDGNKMDCPFLSGAVYNKAFSSPQRGFNHTFGRWEVRAKIPAGPGSFPAHWLLPQAGSWPEPGEIDIMESNAQANQAYQTYHTAYCEGPNPGWYATEAECKASGGKKVHISRGYFAAAQNLSGPQSASPLYAGGYHTFAVEWDPARIRYLVDNAVIGDFKANDLAYGKTTEGDIMLGKAYPVKIPDTPFFMILNQTISQGPSPSGFAEQKHYIDYVKVWDRCSTPEDFCPAGGAFDPSTGKCVSNGTISNSACVKKEDTLISAINSCKNPCPFGGYYDGANCQVAHAPSPDLSRPDANPSGGQLFEYSGADLKKRFYFTPLIKNASWATAAQACPLPGFFDGANCLLGDALDGASYFFWGTTLYYTAACSPWSAAASVCSVPGGLAATAITASSATLNWAFTGAPNYNLRYKPQASTAWVTTTAAASDRKSISGLSDSTSYEFQVESVCSGNTSGYSAAARFTTADVTAPTASLTAPASGAYVRGSAVAVSADAFDKTGVAGVQFTLDGAKLGAEDMLAPYGINWNTTLASNGPHALRAVVRDSAGNSSVSATLGVMVDNAAPAISGVAAASITAGGAVINWTTNEPSDSQVEYGTTTLYGQATAINSSLVSAHGMGLSGLSASSLYHYRVRSRDQAGNPAVSGDFTLTTPAAPDTTAPMAALTAPAAGAFVSGSAVTVSASASDNIGVAGLQFKLDGANLGAEDNAAPYSLSWNTALASNGPHTLTAVARDAAGNRTILAARIVTVDNEAPAISAAAASAISSSTALIGWATSEASDSQVEYGTSTAYGRQSALSASLVTSHSAGLSGLLASTLYHYRIKSRDLAGNLGVSGDLTFVTAAAPDITAPIAAIQSPKNRATVAYNSKVGVTATASDRAGVSRVELWVDGRLSVTQAFSPTVRSLTATLGWYASVRGTHLLQVFAYDAAGNKGASTVVSVTVSRGRGLVYIYSPKESGFQPAEEEPRALLLSLQRGESRSLAFSDEVEEASLVDLRGRVLMRQTRQGSPIVMDLQQSSNGRLLVESGLWLINMKEKDGRRSVRPLMVVK